MSGQGRTQHRRSGLGVAEGQGRVAPEAFLNQRRHTQRIFIAGGRTALNIILSNLISNAVKYSDKNGVVNIGVNNGWLYIENSYEKKEELDINKIFEVNFDLNKENSNGLGLYIIKNILLNYGIKYKMIKNKIGIVFLIELSDHNE